jgi:hypothetical protein
MRGMFYPRAGAVQGCFRPVHAVSAPNARVRGEREGPTSPPVAGASLNLSRLRQGAGAQAAYQIGTSPCPRLRRRYGSVDAKSDVGTGHSVKLTWALASRQVRGPLVKSLTSLALGAAAPADSSRLAMAAAIGSGGCGGGRPLECPPSGAGRGGRRTSQAAGRLLAGYWR